MLAVDRARASAPCSPLGAGPLTPALIPSLVALTEEKFAGKKMLLRPAEQFLPSPPLLVMMGAGLANPLHLCNTVRWKKQLTAPPLDIFPSQSPALPSQSFTANPVLQSIEERGWRAWYLHGAGLASGVEQGWGGRSPAAWSRAGGGCWPATRTSSAAAAPGSRA